MALVSTEAVILRSHDYGDTSRILRCYSKDYGLVSVMAKGARGRSARGDMPITNFSSGILSLYLKKHRDLHTMKDFSCHHLRNELAKTMLRFAGASAIAEIILAHADHECRPEIFKGIESGLDTLESIDSKAVPTAALSGLWQVTRVFGFEPQLEVCIRCGKQLKETEAGRFNYSAGGLACDECAEETDGPRIGPVARIQIRQLVQGSLRDTIDHPKKHLAVLERFLSYHVLSRPLKSLSFMERLLAKI